MTNFRPIFPSPSFRLLSFGVGIGVFVYFLIIKLSSVQNQLIIISSGTPPENLIERYDALLRLNLVPRPVQYYKLFIEPTLVFTLLGEHASRFQSYVSVSLLQARRTNPTVRIVLILNRNVYKNGTAAGVGSISKFLQSLDINAVFYDELIDSNIFMKEFRKLFFVQGAMEPDGNKQFVQFTTERLVVIHAYMVKSNLKNVFHMENDNMLYADLKTLSRRMCACSVTFAMPKAAVHLAIVSFIFIHDAWALEQFVRWCIEVFRLGSEKASSYLGTTFINDMSLGARYLDLRAASLSQTKLTGVAMLPAQFYTGEDTPCLWSPSLQKIKYCGGSSSSFIERQKIIVDACVLGQWFGGTFHAPGVPHWEPTRLVDPRGKSLDWRVDAVDHLWRPFIDNISVVNLHIHSKQLEKFASVRKN
jgi:hypothetical protein